jgi:hypothetical protein
VWEHIITKIEIHSLIEIQFLFKLAKLILYTDQILAITVEFLTHNTLSLKNGDFCPTLPRNFLDVYSAELICTN